MLIKRSTILLLNGLNGGSKLGETGRLIDRFRNGCLLRYALLSRSLCKSVSDPDKKSAEPSSVEKSAAEKTEKASLFPDPILKG